MDRITLKEQLEKYRTPYEEESAFIQDFIQLTEDPIAFNRERLAGHFTASSWIVNPDRTHTLLTLHKKLGRWLQLGGHADGNENLMEVALKEAFSLRIPVKRAEPNSLPRFEMKARRWVR